MSGCPGTAGQARPKVSALTNAPTYVYEKRGLYEFRRPDGSLRHLKEKVYEVRLYRGMTRNRLIRVDSRELAPKESQRETEGERRWRSAYTAGRTAFRDERMEDVLNEDLLARFEFQFEGRELVRGRPTIALTFRPKSADLPNERLIDRVINKLEGRIRVDEGDDEIFRPKPARRPAAFVGWPAWHAGILPTSASIASGLFRRFVRSRHGSSTSGASPVRILPGTRARSREICVSNRSAARSGVEPSSRNCRYVGASESWSADLTSVRFDARWAEACRSSWRAGGFVA